jgi:hypothetical protein
MATFRSTAIVLACTSALGCIGCDRSRTSAPPVAVSEPPAPIGAERAGETRARNVVRKKLPRNFKSIALEYTVVLVDQNGNERPVDPAEHTFEVGDSFLVRIRPQDDLYVYVFNEGPQGERTCLMPSVDEPPHLVKSGREISLPDDGGYFTFEPPAGEEKLIVVALPEPTEDLRMLASAVFTERASGIRSGPASEARTAADKALEDLREKSGAGGRTRGPVRKVVERLEDDLAAGTTFSHVEPPLDGETSSYGIAVISGDGAGPKLVLDIPLRSRGGAGSPGGN